MVIREKRVASRPIREAVEDASERRADQLFRQPLKIQSQPQADSKHKPFTFDIKLGQVT